MLDLARRNEPWLDAVLLAFEQAPPITSTYMLGPRNERGAGALQASPALERASRLLERWFDASSQAYPGVQDELAALSETDIAPELPDISGPWAQLKVIRQARAAPSPAEESPQSEPPAWPLEESGDSEGDTDSTEPAPGESG